MGSSSRFHGLTKIGIRRPKSNVNKRLRKAKLSVRKKTVNEALRAALKKVPEIS